MVARAAKLGERGGLQRDDIVREINRYPVTDAASLHRELAAIPPASAVPVSVHRRSRDVNEYVALERPAAP